MNVSGNGCMCLCVSPATDWRPVQAVPCLSPCGSWELTLYVTRYHLYVSKCYQLRRQLCIKDLALVARRLLQLPTVYMEDANLSANFC